MRMLIKIHRYCGLITAVIVIFYSITGILLNHRKSFEYFINKERSTHRVPLSDTGEMRSFIDFYKGQVKRSDDPKVIRIKGNETIELLYGSHGKTTYIIKPSEGVMEKVEKMPKQPITLFNNLHKAVKTGKSWIVLSDILSVFIIITVITALFLLRYTVIDYILVVCGTALFLTAVGLSG